jgi:uncharacterized protein (TIGR03086 family)
MQPTEQLRSIIPALTRLVDGIRPSQLGDPTPCDEFTVHDVLDHMIVGGTTLAGAFRGETPEVTAPAVYGRVPHTEFRAAMDDLLDAIEADGALDRPVDSPFGTMTGGELAALVALDGLVHGWDLAVATGRPLSADPDVVAAVATFAHTALTDEVRATGAFAAPTTAPADATPLESLAALTGRSVGERRRPAQAIHLDKASVPTKIDVPGAHARQIPGFGDASGYGSMAGEYFSLAAGTDIAPLLVGLDDDACHAPHWGYMLDGEVVVSFVGGEDTVCTAGEIFYWPPGHSVRVVADAEVVLFSPEHEHLTVLDHMLDRMGAAT